MDFAAEWQVLLEKDDRTSPEEYPDMALIAHDEFVVAMHDAYKAGLEVAAQWHDREYSVVQQSGYALLTVRKRARIDEAARVHSVAAAAIRAMETSA